MKGMLNAGRATVSVITFDYGPKKELGAFIKALSRCSEKPSELLVVRFGRKPSPLPSAPFPVVEILIPLHTHCIPFSSVRNLAVEIARGEKLIFLDVACIPGPSLLADYSVALDSSRTICIGSIRERAELSGALQIFVRRVLSFFRSGGDSAIDGIRFTKHSGPEEVAWSCNFGIRKSSYRWIGGFDEAYWGFGGEDFDFLIRAAKKGIKVEFIEAAARFRHRSNHQLPTPYLESIVRNARIFRKKWGFWPTRLWLDELGDRGYIRYEPDSDIIEIQEPA